MDIEEFFAEVILQADELQQAYDAARRLQQLRVPFVTVSLTKLGAVNDQVTNDQVTSLSLSLSQGIFG